MSSTDEPGGMNGSAFAMRCRWSSRSRAFM
jgi:hypothetical protein